jgi:hypothetical protein
MRSGCLLLRGAFEAQVGGRQSAHINNHKNAVVALELHDLEHELRAHSALGIVLAALGLQLAADKSELAARGLELAV